MSDALANTKSGNYNILCYALDKKNGPESMRFLWEPGTGHNQKVEFVLQLLDANLARQQTQRFDVNTDTDWDAPLAQLLTWYNEYPTLRVISPHTRGVLQRVAKWYYARAGSIGVFKQTPFHAEGYQNHRDMFDLVEEFHKPAIITVEQRQHTYPEHMCQALGIDFGSIMIDHDNAMIEVVRKVITG
jgi:hypothetical protein